MTKIKPAAHDLNDQGASEDHSATVLLGGALTLILGFILVGAVVAQLAPNLPANVKAITKLGPLGDYIGGILNPIVALLALGALLRSIRIQKQELRETREAMDQQRREQRFFDLLGLYGDALRSIELNGNIGKLALRHLMTTESSHRFINLFIRHGFESFYKEPPPNLGPQQALAFLMRKELDQFTIEKMTDAWGRFSPVLDHYFRTIFAILKRARIILGEGEDRFEYVSLFRAQLSRDELAVITFNILFDEEGKKMRTLVADYGLLKHLAPSKLRSYAETALPPQSFGRGWLRLKGLLKE